jgi:hypothetical protein
LRRALAGAFAGTVLGLCLAWLTMLLVVPDTGLDAAVGIMLVAGAAGGVGGSFVVRRPRRTIG